MRLNPPGPRFTALLAALVVVLAMAAPAAQLRAQEAPHRIAAASPAELIGIVKHNVLLSGDLVLRMQAQQRLVALGRQDPERIVPLLVAELAAPRGDGKKASHQRLALIEMLRDMAAAAAAVPALAALLDDPDTDVRRAAVEAWAASARRRELRRRGSRARWSRPTGASRRSRAGRSPISAASLPKPA